jgi:hypothetical protein
VREIRPQVTQPRNPGMLFAYDEMGCLHNWMVPGARHGPNVYPFDSSGWQPNETLRFRIRFEN